MATTEVVFTIADIMATDFMEAVRMATDTDSTVARAMATAEGGVTTIAPSLMADGDMDSEEVIMAGAAFTEGVAIMEAATSTAEVDSMADIGKPIRNITVGALAPTIACVKPSHEL